MDKSQVFSETITNEEQAWLVEKLHKQIIHITRLKQGNTNTVFLLYCTNDQKFIFKRLNRTLLTEVDRFHEIQVHKLASEHLLSSNIIASDEKFLLQEFIEGKALTKNWPIKTLAKQLYLIHQLPAKFASKQSLALDLEFLYKKLLSKNMNMDKDRFQKMFDLAVTLDKESPLNTLCHGDLSFSNLVSTQLIPVQDAKIMILDWEYSRLASAVYDLAATISINKLNVEDGDQLIAYYYSFQKGYNGGFDEIKREINKYLSLFYYLNKLWRLEVDIS